MNNKKLIIFLLHKYCAACDKQFRSDEAPSSVWKWSRFNLTLNSVGPPLSALHDNLIKYSRQISFATVVSCCSEHSFALSLDAGWVYIKKLWAEAERPSRSLRSCFACKLMLSMERIWKSLTCYFLLCHIDFITGPKCLRRAREYFSGWNLKCMEFSSRFAKLTDKICMRRTNDDEIN